MSKSRTLHALMAQRIEPKTSLDFFPTPPWATRALMRHVITMDVSGMTCLEPACGAGHMSNVLRGHFRKVRSSDIHDHGYERGHVRDFIIDPYDEGSFDWVITNPPFNLSRQFILEALRVAKVGVAMFARTTLLETKRRYEEVFRVDPPSTYAQFVERVPLTRGRVLFNVGTASSYGWFVWYRSRRGRRTVLEWIPPCRVDLERPSDYEDWNDR